MRKPRIKLFPEPPEKGRREADVPPAKGGADSPAAEPAKPVPQRPPLADVRERISKQVEADPDAAVKLIRSWLKED